MKLAAKKNKILSAIMTCVLAITLMAGFPAVKAYAASGTVYSCTINRCYAHPVTGVIEDSGGESSYATGQGMVEGCVYSNGILEVSDDGAYYLTIRMSLMDYTSGHFSGTECRRFRLVYTIRNRYYRKWFRQQRYNSRCVYACAKRKLCSQRFHVCRTDGKRCYFLSVSEQLQ